MPGQADVQKNRANYKRPRRPYKVALAGVYGVGKTSLFKRMFQLGFSKEKTTFSKSKDTHEEIFDDDKIIIPVRLETHNVLYQLEYHIMFYHEVYCVKSMKFFHSEFIRMVHFFLNSKKMVARSGLHSITSM